MELKAPQSRSLRNRIAELLFDATLSDVTFLIGDPPYPIHCHRLIIATGSKVFESMLFGQLAEKSEILIPDITYKGFKTMLRYLYTDEVIFENELNAMEVAYGAKKYLMKDLFEMCEDYLSSETKLNIESVIPLHEKAALLEMKRLQNRCLLFVCRNTQEVFASQSFLSAAHDTLEDILKLDFLQLDSEADTVRAIWIWGMERCKDNGIEDTSENVRSVTRKLRKYIRFLSLKSEELETIFENYPFFDELEQLVVLWNIAMPSEKENSKMPLNLCEVSRKRSLNNLFHLKMHDEYRYGADYGGGFSVKQVEQRVTIKTEGPGIIVAGFILEMETIPCYSSSHRHLTVEVSASNETSNFCTVAKSCQRESGRERVFLEEFLVLSEGDVGQLVFKTEAEGVRLMEGLERVFSRKIKNSLVTFHFVGDNTRNRIVFPIKEILCLPDIYF